MKTKCTTWAAYLMYVFLGVTNTVTNYREFDDVHTAYKVIQ
jgi:hypothetical protein